MNTERFNVILKGTVLPGYGIDEVVAALATLIKREKKFASHLDRRIIIDS